MSLTLSRFAYKLPKLTPEKTKDRQLLDDKREKFMKSEARTGGLCMGIHAPWSKGKTLTLVFFAKRTNEDDGIPVLANFRMLKVSPFKFLDDVEILKEIFGYGVFLDEIRKYMDSYMSRGMKVRFTSNLAADLGKQSCNLYYSDQHYNRAPTAIKANLSLIGEPDYDEESQYVTLYLYQSIEDYLMKNLWFYFGFYGPDYWPLYDTSFKIEDYKLKFKVERYAEYFLEWKEASKTVAQVKISKSLIGLWNQAEGMEMTVPEMNAIDTYLGIIEKLEQGKHGKRSG